MKDIFTTEDLFQLRDNLPLKGIAMIAIDTGISRPTIYKFFQSKRIKRSIARKIITSALKIIGQEDQRDYQLKREIKKLTGK
jgi:DNA-binding phage protein